MLGVKATYRFQFKYRVIKIIPKVLRAPALEWRDRHSATHCKVFINCISN